MKVKCLSNITWAHEGFRVENYYLGTEAEMDGILLDVALSEKWVAPLVEEKAIDEAPENKAKKTWRKK